MQTHAKEASSPALRFCRSDLACEAPKPPETASPDDGVRYVEYTRGRIEVARLTIEGKTGAERIGRDPGTYVTLSCGPIHYLEREEEARLVGALARELRRMAETLTGKSVDRAFRLLVVGLGNADLTADAIGPETVRRLPITRHLQDGDLPFPASAPYCSIAALAPGVLAQTGVETAELVRGVCRSASPDLLLAVDALAARSCTRLAATVQLSDTGLRPGAGIGNAREAIDRESLGLPVVALGVPTVVDSSTLVFDALERAGISEEAITPELERILTEGRSFFVSPKEIDTVTHRVADLLADAIAEAFTIPPEA